jgi:hypothetical protein
MKQPVFALMALLYALACGGCAKSAHPPVTKVHGTVVVSGEPVKDAAVLLTSVGSVKLTGSDGTYEFVDLQPGKYELKVFKEGFQSFNKSIDIAQGKDEEVVVTLSRIAGNLSINKAYVDMGSNEGNNVAGFSIVNAGSTELGWSVTNAARWVSNVDPASGTVTAYGATAVAFTIDRSKLSSNTADNYAILLARSTTAGDGSAAEMLVTVFSAGDGVNITINSDKDYIAFGDFYVQTKDLGGRMDWTSANNACEDFAIGDFDDWHLPNTSELGFLYSKKDAIGGFVTTPEAPNKQANTGYWTSDNNSSDYHYWMSFWDGAQNYAYNSERYRCRCVRRSSPLPEVITLPGSNLMVMRQDAGSASNSSTASSLCEGTKSGYSNWRLPTAAELSTLYTQKATIGGFQSNWYWSSTHCDSYYDSYRTQINFSNGSSICDDGESGDRVRCVRTLP